jgi:1-acyl-sn-glycerol-3-phosphate acyltransferase
MEECSVDRVVIPPIWAETIWRMSWPLRLYFSPKFYGLENINPEKPGLLVGNHTIYGMIDPPFLGITLYRKKGILVRSLGDFAHYKVPFWKEFLLRMGSVPGTRVNCARLMELKEHILVYPGGGREVCKRKGEAYQLIWKDRVGFVRMAVEHGYPIIPVATIGAENAYDILWDAEDFLASPLGKLLHKSGVSEKYLRGGEAIPPFARGLGLTMIPRPEKLYYAFGKPIETSSVQDKTDYVSLMKIRKKVEDSLYKSIRHLLFIREQDTDVGLWRHILKKL